MVLLITYYSQVKYSELNNDTIMFPININPAHLYYKHDFTNVIVNAAKDKYDTNLSPYVNICEFGTDSADPEKCPLELRIDFPSNQFVSYDNGKYHKTYSFNDVYIINCYDVKYPFSHIIIDTVKLSLAQNKLHDCKELLSNVCNVDFPNVYNGVKFIMVCNDRILTMIKYNKIFGLTKISNPYQLTDRRISCNMSTEKLRTLLLFIYNRRIPTLNDLYVFSLYPDINELLKVVTILQLSIFIEAFKIYIAIQKHKLL